MTAPLCPCGATLPVGHPKSVITCPKCGAKSLPQKAAQEGDERPSGATRVSPYWDPGDRLCFAAPSTAKRDQSNGESLGGVVLTGRWICKGNLCNTLSDIPRVHRVADLTGAPYCSQEFNGSRWVLNPEHPAECKCCSRRDKAREIAAAESATPHDPIAAAHAAGVAEERARMAVEIERLQRLAREGWESARAQAITRCLSSIEARADAALATLPPHR